MQPATAQRLERSSHSNRASAAQNARRGLLSVRSFFQARDFGLDQIFGQPRRVARIGATPRV
jgi:hypothetical protein